MSPMALNPVSRIEKALVLQCVALDPPLYWGGLWYHHMSHGFGPRLTVREDSDVATFFTAPNPISLLERALTLSHITRLQTPPSQARLQRDYMSQCLTEA
jgi:hypothetical protein